MNGGEAPVVNLSESPSGTIPTIFPSRVHGKSTLAQLGSPSDTQITKGCHATVHALRIAEASSFSIHSDKSSSE